MKLDCTALWSVPLGLASGDLATPDGGAVHRAGCCVRRSTPGVPEGSVCQALGTHCSPPPRLGRRNWQWPGSHRCRGALRQRGGHGRVRGAAAARHATPQGPVPAHRRHRRRGGRPRHRAGRRGQRGPRHGGTGRALVRPPGILCRGAPRPAPARRGDRGLGLQLPREPRGGHDGALLRHHAALLGHPSSVLHRRIPGPAVPLRGHRAWGGRRAGELRHGARDVVRRPDCHAEVLVGGDNGEAAGRGPAAGQRCQGAGGRVGRAVAGAEGHLQGLPAGRHRTPGP